MSESVPRSLQYGVLEVEGRVLGASNATLRCTLEGGLSCVYKPRRGERPLWDFPTGTLSGREVASYEIDRLLGFDLIPPTVWREDGPAGPGMCQMWIHEEDASRLVDVVPLDRIPRGWLSVLRATDGLGNPVALVHADDPRLQKMAILDAVLNNGDRKGGHVITDLDGRVWAVDHGVTLSVDPKLRTVLWGWAGSPVPEGILEAVGQLAEELHTGCPAVAQWLDAQELRALIERCDDLTASGVFPLPHQEWPAIPWPVF